MNNNRIMNNNTEISNFQELLKIFVTRLEKLQNNEEVTGAKTGAGHKGEKIQEVIEEYATYQNGYICMSMQAGYAGGYTKKSNFLHWYGTGVNICARWKKAEDGKREEIESLFIFNKDYDPTAQKIIAEIKKEELKNIQNIEVFYKSYTHTLLEYRDNQNNSLVNSATQLVEKNYNIILTGAPGTGKTYLAKKIAAKMIGCETTDDLKNNTQFEFVQFHPSYDYTDFVEGLRPINNGNGQVGFELKNGIFKDFCERAADAWIKATNNSKDPKELQRYREENAPKYVFVIDEINRGEISKIFGELFFSIDPGYRGTEGMVSTQYANMDKPNLFDAVLNNGKKGQFFIPENVFIIGTMNDIDRSVESMDFAFRRRFAFMEISAHNTADAIIHQCKFTDKIKLTKAMYAINKKLTELGFSDCYHIGGAYFSKIDKCNDDLDLLWEIFIKGTLYEYFRGEPDADKNKKMEELKNAYDNAH